MPVMTEEQFSHLEAMLAAVCDARLMAYQTLVYPENKQVHAEALHATDLEHTVREAAKKALTK